MPSTSLPAAGQNDRPLPRSSAFLCRCATGRGYVKNSSLGASGDITSASPDRRQSLFPKEHAVMKRLMVFACAALALAAWSTRHGNAAAGEKGDDKGWVQLFNGKDLT